MCIIQYTCKYRIYMRAYTTGTNTTHVLYHVSCIGSIIIMVLMTNEAHPHVYITPIILQILVYLYNLNSINYEE